VDLSSKRRAQLPFEDIPPSSNRAGGDRAWGEERGKTMRPKKRKKPLTLTPKRRRSGESLETAREAGKTIEDRIRYLMAVSPHKKFPVHMSIK